MEATQSLEQPARAIFTAGVANAAVVLDFQVVSGLKCACRAKMAKMAKDGVLRVRDERGTDACTCERYSCWDHAPRRMNGGPRGTHGIRHHKQ